ncbi:beta-mannosidase-like isoform X2 [Neocloeon triangulifer]|uniref:beta-mannosidase-like isoform X2 n=1 Tax=Neocloeon triangulifer TaxID=2078957 RepID=UPI00286EC946|nr:beta-mannosidase-like isoform X2 [Neocloeon triangulifer]
MAVFLCAVLTLICFHSAKSTEIIQDLSSQSVKWTFESQNKTVSGEAIVPGGIFNDLQKEGVLGDELFYRFGDTENRWVSRDNWTFHTEFNTSEDILKSAKTNLVFDGINSVADVFFNGKKLCGCKNMFTRFVFPITDILKKDGSVNQLMVKFQSTIAYAAQQYNKTPTKPSCVPPYFHGECHVNMVRTMQASFGWDWGPALPSQGLWKTVYLEGVTSVAIQDVKCLISLEAKEEFWKVDVTAFLDVSERGPETVDVVVSLVAKDGKKVVSESNKVTIEGGDEPNVKTVLSVPIELVDMWWPNGMNKSQPLYEISIALKNADEILVEKKTRIGFRTIELIQVPVVREDPEKGLTFYFEVNGRPIFAKGSNYIPSHVLPEKGTDPKVAEHLLRSSAEAGFNMLRVWGGGVYETDFFYDLCDELGIMIWQDFMFANSLYPVDEEFLSEVTREVKGTVRRLQHHPSLALWAGNNEMEGAVQDSWWDSSENAKENYKKLFGHVIRDLVMEEDPLTPFVVSSPTNGLKTDEDGFLPEKITAWSGIYGDTHVYQYSSSVDLTNSSMYTIARFVSEYGYQSFPFLRTLQKVTEKEDLSNFDSAFLNTRQHQSGGTNRVFSQTATILMPHNQNSEYKKPEHFEKFVFLTQLSQAIGTGVEALKHRRLRNFFNPKTGIGRTMGSMYWQLNDIWAAPSWGGIDHEGTWKMLHYHMAHIFAPVAISVDHEKYADHLIIYAISDLLEDLHNVQLELNGYKWGQLEPVKTRVVKIETMQNLSAAAVLEGGVRNLLEMDPIKDTVITRDLFLTIQLKDEEGKDLTGPYFHPVYKLNEINFQTKPTLKIEKVVKSETAKEDYSSHYLAVFDIEITTDEPTPYVWLDAGDVRGRFSDNGFILAQSEKTIQFFALQDLDEKHLWDTLSIYSYFHAIQLD